MPIELEKEVLTKMKKVNIQIVIRDDKVGFAIEKTKEMSVVEIIGALELVQEELKGKMKNQLKVEGQN